MQVVQAVQAEIVEAKLASPEDPGVGPSQQQSRREIKRVGRNDTRAPKTEKSRSRSSKRGRMPQRTTTRTSEDFFTAGYVWTAAAMEMRDVERESTHDFD